MRALARVWTIAMNTVREAVRSKLLYVLLFFAVLMILSSTFLAALSYVERERILQDLAEVRARIEELRALLASEDRVTDLILEELAELKEKYGDARRTVIGEAVLDLTTEDLINEEDMVVAITHKGYAKRHVPALYRAQRRGGKGKMGITAKDEDFATKLFIASTHDWLLCFTNRGRVH